MNKPTLLAILSGIGAALYLTAIRPCITRWGATDTEARRMLPGDEFTPEARFISTHAITINAPPDKIWPWIVQIGNERAGWYSYRFVELLVNDGKLLDEGASYRILPQFQAIQANDLIPVGNEAFKVIAVEPNHFLALKTGFDMVEDANSADRTHSGFNFVLEPIDSQTTRLFARARFVSRSLLETLVLLSFLEPGHFIMQTKMLHGIKQRAEGRFPLITG